MNNEHELRKHAKYPQKPDQAEHSQRPQRGERPQVEDTILATPVTIIRRKKREGCTTSQSHSMMTNVKWVTEGPIGHFVATYSK